MPGRRMCSRPSRPCTAQATPTVGRPSTASCPAHGQANRSGGRPRRRGGGARAADGGADRRRRQRRRPGQRRSQRHRAGRSAALLLNANDEDWKAIQDLVKTLDEAAADRPAAGGRDPLEKATNMKVARRCSRYSPPGAVRISRGPGQRDRPGRHQFHRRHRRQGEDDRGPRPDQAVERLRHRRRAAVQAIRA